MKLLKVQEVAELLRVDPATVRRLILSRQLKARNLAPAAKHAMYRIEQAEVERFLEATTLPDLAPRRKAKATAEYRRYF